ncbi:putative bifunctional diguanylate cyclase/phosphodiesterase [Symbioplanes lichenis]|uniref:putative bifunctional diguanylate cyclase/phosphodiesterase n=1 Tax=Symbioplanes lichenis TaxID=1629072 RepID=UPI002738986D|nr:GGDEF domain-containing phosphodiesterase [Actinoplanes lichenis]
MTSRYGRAGYLVWLVVLTAAYYSWPAQHLILWALIGLSGAGAVVAGVRKHRPARRLPWYLIAAALTVFIAGDTLANVYLAAGAQYPYPGPSDALYLLVYPLLAGGLILFVRARAGDRNRAALLDALVPTVSFGLLSWVCLIAPFARATDMGVLEKAVSVAYPLGDVLALAILLRLATGPGRKPAALKLLTVAIVGLLCSDVPFSLARLDEDWAIGGPVDLGWVLLYGCAGLAALHPSMRVLTGDTETTAAGPTASAEFRRLLLLTAASLIAPAVLLAEHLHEGVVDAPVIAAAAGVMFVLVMARVHGLIAEQRQARDRERALRVVADKFNAATTLEEVRTAAREVMFEVLPEASKEHYVQVPPAAGPFQPGVTVLPLGPDTQLMRAIVMLHGTPLRAVTMEVTGSPAELRAVRPTVETLRSQISSVLQRIALATEVSRRDGEAYFRTLIQSASDVILIVGADELIRYASPSAATLFGYDDLIGTPLHRIIADTHHEALRDALVTGHSGRTGEGVDLTAVRADRRLLQVECTIRDLRDDPTVRGLVLTVRDVTERRRLENDLAHQAFHDGLTGLANRVLFRERLEHSWARAELSGHGVGVLFVDLDDFKEVNDTLGHAVGDQLLVAVAERISTAIGRHNTAARMGGDEFAVLVENAGEPGVAEEIAARVVAALAVPVEVSDGLGGSNIVSGAASVGVATSADAKNPTELLRHADLALYLAKGAGKGDWKRYQSDLHTAMVERLALRASLLEAVEHEQFVLQYQPIADVRTGIVVGLEALVRWQHPERGLLGPYHFIELAEESGAIVGIGEWVLREALRQFASWHREQPDLPLRYISVNVSARQFRQPGFVDRVRAALADAGAEPRWLLLEITESLVLRDAEQVWADLETLRALGCRIAIDDFGTGYSSLSYLRQMPVDVLKIDKSFIDDIIASKQQRALVNAIVTLARNLDLTVIAEGIEHADQRSMLGRMGCPYGQGYLFSRPVWPNQVPDLAGAVVLA